MRKTTLKQVPGRVGRRVSIAPKLKTEDEDATETGDVDEWAVAKTVLKPDDQLLLTDDELKEEHTRILTANNPQAPQNIVRFNFKTNQYERVPTVDQLAIHFQMEGNLLHVDSEEAKLQLERESKKAALKGKPEETKQEEEMRDDELMAVKSGPLRNQFNYSERAAQTYNNPFRERGMVTDPPPRSEYCGNVTQWEIYDGYLEDQANLEASKEGKKNKAEKGKEGLSHSDKLRKWMAWTTVDGQQVQDLYSVLDAMKIVERMIIQNNHDDLYIDFKYYEDESDEKRNTGDLLPLWTFKYEAARKLAVTAIAWNPKYSDLFAASFGSYDFLTQSRGMVLFFSLKNSAFPDYMFPTDSGVMSIDIHNDYPYLFVAGMYDGNVAVYNLSDTSQRPAFQSSAKCGKHSDPVWQVKWQPNDLDDNMNFFSVSSDGRVLSWTLKRNELNMMEVIKLKMSDVRAEGPDNTLLNPLGCGMTFDFHKPSGHLFLVGTEEGRLHKCSKLYSDDEYLATWPTAHHMAIYRVIWNPFHPDVFLTCSADWTIKMWDHNYKEPLFTYDLNSAVADVVWAPYSSTVFAACTADGKVLVWDLNEDKWEPICDQLIVKRRKLTHLAFNPTSPLINVGDDRGHIMSFKLSPNLRKKPKVQQSLAESLQQKDKAPAHLGPEFEIQKMEKILIAVREPDANKTSH